MNDVGLQPPPPARFDACDEKRTIQPLAMRLRCRQSVGSAADVDGTP